MAEPRKIVLILGNGFDLDLGLKTSYKDFWESEFCPKKYPAPLIHHLNSKWEDNIDDVRWYDLENELLAYYKGLHDSDNGEDIITEEEKNLLKDFTSYGFKCGWYNDRLELVESLINKGVLSYRGGMIPTVGEHLKEDALKTPIWRDRKALSLIKEGLCKYLKSIDTPSTDSNTVASHLMLAIKKTADAGNFVSIFTFNYTPVRFQGYTLDGIPVHYLHGSCEDGKIIIGTKDDLTISESYDFLQKAMDPAFHPASLVTDLQDADEVIIFGHSLGENDRQYFAPFFKQRVDINNPSKKDITVFTRDEASEQNIKRSLQKMTYGNLSTLYSINSPKIIKTACLQEDQQSLYDFLVAHKTDEHYASEVISNLLPLR